MKNAPLVLFALLLSQICFAQEKIRSSKIIYDQGLEEIFTFQKTNDGFIALGEKGDAAETKKLWWMKFNTKMELQSSKMIGNAHLTSPYKLLHLSNGSDLILAQNEQDFNSYPVLICVNSFGELLWSKEIKGERNFYINDMQLSDNGIILCGNATGLHTQEKGDKVVIIKMDILGNTLWQNEYDLGNVELNSRQLLIGNRGELFIAGSYLDLNTIVATNISDQTKTRIDYKMKIKKLAAQKLGQDTIFVEDPLTGDLKTIVIVETPDDIEKVNTVKPNSVKSEKGFFMLQLSTNGNYIRHKMIKDYVPYSSANNVVKSDDGFVAVLNNENYFGDGILITLNEDLLIQSSKSIEGSPIIFSGICKQNNQYIVGAIFSNDLENYAPGFVIMDNNFNIQSAKSDKSFFRHFFINEINLVDEDNFVLCGTGYEGGKGSDIYILPFTKSGASACESVNYNLYWKNETCTISALQKEVVSATFNSLQWTNIQLSAIEHNSFNSGDICAAPEDPVYQAEQNKTWTQWKGNNKDAFTMKIPADWLQISPNPSSGNLKITYMGMQNEQGLFYKIIDPMGRVVRQQGITNQDEFMLDLSNLPNGIYNILLSDGAKAISKEFILRR